MKGSVWGMVLAAVTTITAITPTMAEAHDRGRHRGWYKSERHHHRDYRRHDDRRYYGSRGCRSSGTTGLILGGAAGALLGREVDRYGDRTPGTIIGAGAGALLGREIDRGC